MTIRHALLAAATASALSVAPGAHVVADRQTWRPN